MPYASDAYAAFCAQAEQRGHLRRLNARLDHSARLLDFSHNDYLGFAHHPQLIHAAQRAAQRYGVGATGSRLLSGDSLLAHALERRIARSKQAPRALVFSSGYTLNTGVIAALLDRRVLKDEPAVFCDRLVHASFYHAFATAGVHPQRYHHNDLDHLASLLAASQARKCTRFIFTESVFGMDGDCAPIDELRSLARRYDALLYIDEAHATGLHGPEGSGLASGVVQDGGIAMGTFSKALGGSGAYLACNEGIASFLLQRCGSLIYSTAAAPATLASALTAWRLLPHYGNVRRATLERATQLRAQLRELGFDVGKSTTHILPLIFSNLERALTVHAHLAEHGIRTSLIRPPTVPPNAIRLRLAISANHDDSAIAALVSALRAFQ